ncbi:MAG: iron-sulfur cluster assembly protein [Sphingobacteriales bacterium]|jgi:iron-sulfur cluster assembly protein
MSEVKSAIIISPTALKRLEAIKVEESYTDTHFLRVSVESGGCSGLSYKMDWDTESKPTDQVATDESVKVVMDMRSFLYLAGTTLDFTAGLQGKGFDFINPNASRSCACGESFSV